MQSELSGGSDPKKERADGILCDDIFGETPTGVRKLVRFIFMHPVVIYVVHLSFLFYGMHSDVSR